MAFVQSEGRSGGNNLTLHGTSFSPELSANEVTVGGEVCKVLEASVNRLVPGSPWRSP